MELRTGQLSFLTVREKEKMGQTPSNFLGGPTESVGFTAHFFMFSVKVEVSITLRVRGLLPRDQSISSTCPILTIKSSLPCLIPAELSRFTRYICVII